MRLEGNPKAMLAGSYHAFVALFVMLMHEDDPSTLLLVGKNCHVDLLEHLALARSLCFKRPASSTAKVQNHGLRLPSPDLRKARAEDHLRDIRSSN